MNTFLEYEAVQSVVRNMGWLFFDRIIRFGLGLIVTVLLARYLGPEDFGFLSFTLALVTIASGFVGLGIREILIRDIVTLPEMNAKTISASLLLQMLSGVFVYSILLIIGAWLKPGNSEFLLLLSVLGLVILVRFTDVFVAWFEARVSMKPVVLVQSFFFISFSVVKISLIYFDAPLLVFGVAIAAEAVCAGIVLYPVFIMKYSEENLASFPWSRASYLLKEGWPLFLASISITLYMRFDQIMIGQMASFSQVAIYNVGVRIVEGLYIIPTIIVISVFPKILAIRGFDKSKFSRRVQDLYNVLAMLSLAICFPISYFADEIIFILFGNDFLGAGKVLSVYMWVFVVVCFGIARGKWLIAEGLQRFSAIFTLATLTLNVIGNYLLIPNYGSVGAAWATVFSVACGSLLVPAIFQATRVSSRMFFLSFNPILLGVIYSKVRRKVREEE